MGEYADMIIDGLVDAETGEVIDGDSPGYPRTKRRGPIHSEKIECFICGKKVKNKQGLRAHKLAKHPGQRSEWRRRPGWHPRERTMDDVNSLRSGGWTFAYQEETRCVQGTHPLGGELAIVEVYDPRRNYDHHEIGRAIAEMLNSQPGPERRE